ncbi:MAG: hypothetical protein ACOCXA_05820, partial [Planctomycetota bacterium]
MLPIRNISFGLIIPVLGLMAWELMAACGWGRLFPPPSSIVMVLAGLLRIDGGLWPHLAATL